MNFQRFDKSVERLLIFRELSEKRINTVLDITSFEKIVLLFDKF